MFSVYVKFVKQTKTTVKKSTTNNCQKKLCTFALSLTRPAATNQINKFSEKGQNNKQTTNPPLLALCQPTQQPTAFV